MAVLKSPPLSGLFLLQQASYLYTMGIYRFIIFGLLVICSSVQAQIYKVVTPDGRVIYTDSPPEDTPAEEVDLPDLIIEPATRVRNQTAGSDAASEGERIEMALPTPTISQPAEQQVIPPGQRQVTIVAQVNIQLPAGFGYILLINGSIQGEPVSSPAWTLENPNPGEQRAQVIIVDAQGSRRVSSAIRTFYVIR